MYLIGTPYRRAPYRYVLCRRTPHRPLLLPGPKFLTPKLLRAEIASRNCVPEAFPLIISLLSQAGKSTWPKKGFLPDSRQFSRPPSPPPHHQTHHVSSAFH